MEEKEEKEENNNINTNIELLKKGINNYELFDKIVKRIDEDVLKDKNMIEIDDNEIISKIHNLFSQLYSDSKNLLDIKNKFGNNLSQYYLSSGRIILSLEIIKIYYKIYVNEIDDKKNFIDWLINNNRNEKNIFEIGIEIQSNPKDIIYFYKQLFEIIEKIPNNNIIYRILEKRKENIFILSIKEDKYYLLLFLYEKIKKYYPSSNPLDIKNKLGLAPLHFSSYYLSREMTDMLLISGCNVNIEDNRKNIPLHFAVKGGDLSIVKKLIFYGGDRKKINNEKLSPSDFAKKYGNSAMINLFTSYPFNDIVNLRDKKYDKLFILLLLGCIMTKYIIYEYFWKSYISDFFCLLSFIYIITKSKNYYLFSYANNKDKNDITFEDLFIQCNFDKIKIKKICSKCKIIKKFGTKHCIVCDSCVEDFDHHCYWINKCINSKIIPEFLIFLLITLLCLIINLIAFYFELKRILLNKSNSKNYIYYIKISLLSLYLFIFCFGSAIIGSLLYQRFVEKISSKKKMTLEENLLNKKNNEDEIGEKNNIINNSNDNS